MSLSAIGEAVLMAREGRVLKAYRDTQGVWTIGAGVTSASGLIKVRAGLVLSPAECDALNKRAFAQYAGYVDKALHGTWVDQNVYDALVSFCYNVGPGAFGKSTCLARIKAGDLQGAKAGMLLFRKPALIIPRRQAEADQLVTPYATRLPERVRGSGPVRFGETRVARPAPSAAPPPPVARPAPAARPRAAHTAPAWVLAIGRFIDVLFGPRLPAH
ncbi:lysozyme [Methylobacterium sp. E-046]|uniref:lysozyme n=1 Tax=Methylobacterium sp. E-046 TaxID=2836576 RepID=UPI001FBA767F|nr:lysozyme [Methylobacterium sp. E-046]MCJ2098925.1 lysozyme [Methylobacterium sp. E-046]